MRKSLLLAFALVLGSAAVHAQQSLNLKGLSREWTDLGFPSEASLKLNLDPGGVTILPSEDGHLRIRYVGRAEQDLSQVRLRFDSTGKQACFELHNSPHNSFEVELQVPKRVDLSFQMSAGSVSVRGIEGNKEIQLGAGEISVKVDNPAEYGPVSASVWVGEINLGPFGDSKGGLFRSFHTTGAGRYRLMAKVKSGEVDFVK